MSDAKLASVRSEALKSLGQWLRSQDYSFTTVSPATHATVLANRSQEIAENLRDVFGWSMRFADTLVPEPIRTHLAQAHLLERQPSGLLKSRVRFSSIGEHLFPHSAYPTIESDAIFFGPDTYRFVRLLAEELKRRPLPDGARVLDTCCGSGAGGVMSATLSPSSALELTLSDISKAAQPFAMASLALARLPNARFIESDLFNSLEGQFDLIIANPPYLNDPTLRKYRHGGGQWGGSLSERIVDEGLERLSPGGRLVLYTGTAISQGTDYLHEALLARLSSSGCEWSYEEIDPDVFGEELTTAAYNSVERIAVIGLVVDKR